jgi:SIR2-like protein
VSRVVSPGRGLAVVIEPMISLAFSVHSSRGAYVLLLGSGVSRAAGIPSGWEVVLDLIERVATLRGDDTAGDPAAWYQAHYGGEPDYAVLLGELAASPAERSRLLRAYFEPTEDEREQGLKLPTAAHRAIARLVARGYVRVIVTTNFDRLLELALEAEGVVPTVIATPDAVAGALPTAHTPCTIIKLHGDYLDARIKNTPDELAAYDARVDQLLDRVLDEYGLIVAGWSAEWDTALRDAISRCASRRFTTFWAARGELGGQARALAEQRRAVSVPITDADSFFVELEEKVTALEDLQAPHPLTAKVAVATVKRYLADDRHRIRLFDLVNDEVAHVERETSDAAFPLSGNVPNADEMTRRLDRYEAICGPLTSIMAVGFYWGEAEHRPRWAGVLERLANRFTEYGGLQTWLNLRLYPVVLALYAGGLGAVAANKLETLEALLSGTTTRQLGREEGPLILECAVPHVVDEDLLPAASGRRDYTPASDRLADALREPLREFLPHQEQYEEAFDRFEYLFALAYADYRERGGDVWAPLGSFGWRQRRRGDGAVWNKVEAEATKAGAGWGFLQGGLFGGDPDRFRGIQRAFHEQVMSRSHW